MWTEKKSLLSKLMKNMLTKKTPNGNVHSLIGKAYDKKILGRKKIVGRWSPEKKTCFPPEVKKKVCKQQKL